MKLSKDKKTGIWKVRFRGKDGTKTISTHCTKWADACKMVELAKIKEIELAVRAGVVNAAALSLAQHGERKRLGELVEEFRCWRETVGHSRNTIHNSTLSLRRMVDGVENLMPHELSEMHVNCFVNDDGGARASTRAIRLSHATAFCDWMAAKGYVQGNVAKLVKVDLSRLGMEQKEGRKHLCFRTDEIERLLSITTTWWHYAVLMGRYAGMRLGDIACMEHQCWPLEEDELIVWTEKRDKRVCLKFSEMGEKGHDAMVKARLLARSQMGQLQGVTSYVFPEEAAVAKSARRRSVHSKQFSRLCKMARIEGKSFHSLRRTFVTDAKRKGIPMSHISAQVGHSSTKTTERYVVPTTQRKFA